jgi:hypothetical protein
LFAKRNPWHAEGIFRRHARIPSGGQRGHVQIRVPSVATGIENYTEECVKIKKVLSNMLSLCTVTHVVFVPLGGVDGPGLFRDFYDLDVWLR